MSNIFRWSERSIDGGGGKVSSCLSLRNSEQCTQSPSSQLVAVNTQHTMERERGIITTSSSEYTTHNGERGRERERNIIHTTQYNENNINHTFVSFSPILFQC